MYLKNLWLHQFKNHKQKSFEFTNGINAIYGNNGVGKTNILDAVHYLCNGKSYFTNADSKVITKGENKLSVRGIFEQNEGETDDILIAFDIDKKKTIKKNQKNYKRLIDHVGIFPVVMVTPTDIALIYDGSEDRRRFMDLVLCQTDQQYIQALQAYKKLLEARNKILKQMAEKGIKDTTLLEGYTLKMIAPADYIAKSRKQFIGEFSPLFEKNYIAIAENNDEIKFAYETDHLNEGAEKQFFNQMQIDIKAGRTTEGIHKDDLLFTLEDEPLKKFASQGQIKSFLIALKIAQFDYLFQKTGKKPLLLLDDIFEKIDETRAQLLINMVGEAHFGQIFISDTHKSRLEKHIFGLKTSINIIPL